jgi:hypothetical protein
MVLLAGGERDFGQRQRTQLTGARVRRQLQESGWRGLVHPVLMLAEFWYFCKVRSTVARVAFCHGHLPCLKRVLLLAWARVGFLILAVHAAQPRWNIESNPLVYPTKSARKERASMMTVLNHFTFRSRHGSLRTLAHPSVPLGLQIFIALSPIQLAGKVGPNGSPSCPASSMLPPRAPPKRDETVQLHISVSSLSESRSYGTVAR